MKLKNNKGITLIALVVTIIVLIILAVVSINLILGENGIISKAEKTSDAQRYARIEEEVTLWKSNNKIAKYSKEGNQTRADLLNQLVTKGLITPEEKTTIEENGKITLGEKTISIPKTLVEMYDTGELKIGDYVNYKNPESGEVTILGTDSGMRDFRDFKEGR